MNNSMREYTNNPIVRIVNEMSYFNSLKLASISHFPSFSRFYNKKINLIDLTKCRKFLCRIKLDVFANKIEKFHFVVRFVSGFVDLTNL